MSIDTNEGLSNAEKEGFSEKDPIEIFWDKLESSTNLHLTWTTFLNNPDPYVFVSDFWQLLDTDLGLSQACQERLVLAAGFSDQVAKVQRKDIELRFRRRKQEIEESDGVQFGRVAQIVKESGFTIEEVVAMYRSMELPAITRQ